MCGAIVTSPFDVVKTRLQSSLFREKHTAVGIMGSGGGAVVGAPRPSGGLLYNFVETGHILRSVRLDSYYDHNSNIRPPETSTEKNPPGPSSKVSVPLS